MALQFVFGLITINWEGGRKILECIGSKVTQFLLYSEQGALFVYGHLSQPHDNHGPIFAFSVGNINSFPLSHNNLKIFF